jgi:hypothetical protein
MKCWSPSLYSLGYAHRFLIFAKNHFAVIVTERLNDTGYLVGATQRGCRQGVQGAAGLW